MPHKCTTCARNFEDGSKEMLSGCPNCGGTTFQYLPDGGTVTESSESIDSTSQPGVQPPDRPEVPGSTVAETIGRATTKVRDLVADVPGNTTGPERPRNGAGPERSGGVAGPEHSGDGLEATVTMADDAGEEGADESEIPSENVAQSSARREMVAPEELPDGPRSAGIGVGSTGNEGVDRGSDPESASPAAGSTGLAERNRSGRREGGDAAVAPGSSAPESSEPPQNPEGRVVDTPASDSPDISELRKELNDQFEGIRILDPGQYELNLMELYEREETIIALRENGRYVIEPPESWRGD